MERALPDRYELRGRLGGGGFGDVFQAWDRRLERLVAIKAMTVASADERRRASDEAKLLARLNHPHLVNIFDADDVEDLFLLFMEFVAGKALDKVSRGLPPETVCGIGLAAGDALAYVHGRPMLHRDIKPANLLLADDGTLKIVDFGIAKLLEHTAAFGQTGTPFWMAPEQRNFAELGPATDLYSLGLVLYWLFAGQLPARPRVGPLTGVHAALAAVVMRAVDEDIDARYPSAHAFAVDLAEAAAEALGAGWLKRSGLILRVDDTIREAATCLPSPPIRPTRRTGGDGRQVGTASGWLPSPPIQPIQPPRRFEDAVRPVPGDSAGDRATTPPGQPHPPTPTPPAGSPARTPLPAQANPGGSTREEDQSRPVSRDAERASPVAHRGYRPASPPAPSTSPVVRRRRWPLAIGVLLTGLLAAAVVTTVALLPRSSSPLITTVAGTGTGGFTGDGGPATHAQLANPDGVAVDNTGTLYIADQDNNRVRRVGTDGTITTLAGTGTAGYAGDGGPATHAQLANPHGVAVDSTGTLYIADEGNQRVRRVGTDGTITTVAGTGTEGFTGDGGPATHAQLAYPEGVAVDRTGTLYITDQGNQRVRRVGTDGTITTVAGTGTAGYAVYAGYAGDGGPATHAQLANPHGVAVDSTGTLYIADLSNNRVRRVGTDGTITTVAGTGTEGFTGDGGPATHAQLAYPEGVAVDRTGILYITDQDNHRVRRVGTDGTITTVAGTGTEGDSGDGGPATHAQLANPDGVAVDNTGTLYITDRGNHRVRRVATGSQ
ncbi:protein kinase domain-containing protein [Frankia sp. Cas3]|uniref:NHL domain-containing protein n=1 Tax=Frankia sp. Cas3 TaxID=3073926 RepID=UPI002AD3E53C|nr:protein kinase [Frankia sp. Cas3]